METFCVRSYSKYLSVKDALIKDKQNLLYPKVGGLFIFPPWNALLIVACKSSVSPHTFPYFTDADVKVLNVYQTYVTPNPFSITEYLLLNVE
jgi:hypothetical protein